MIQIGKRIIVEDSVIRISSPKNFFILVFVPMWIIMWTIGGVSAVMQFMASGNKEEALFLLVWLGFWVAAELFALYVFLWAAFGYEMIAVEFGNLKIKRSIFGFGSEKSYQISKIANLRAAGFYMEPMSLEFSMAYWGLTGGTIAFDYEGKTVRLGIGLEEGDANQLVGELKGRLNLPPT